MTEVYSKDHEYIESSPGDKFSIQLDAIPAAGYEWHVQIDESIVRLIDRRFTTPSPDVIGAGGLETFTFEPISEGETVLHMHYKRVWEAEPVEECTFRLHIIAKD
jgi:predicted secreted protein